MGVCIVRYYFEAVEWTIAETATTEFYTSQSKGRLDKSGVAQWEKGGGGEGSAKYYTLCAITTFIHLNTQILIGRNIKLIKGIKVIGSGWYFQSLYKIEEYVANCVNGNSSESTLVYTSVKNYIINSKTFFKFYK